MSAKRSKIIIGLWFNILGPSCEYATSALTLVVPADAERLDDVLDVYTFLCSDRSAGPTRGNTFPATCIEFFLTRKQDGVVEAKVFGEALTKGFANLVVAFVQQLPAKCAGCSSLCRTRPEAG